ncbi:SDR family oxidoreductase [Clostridium sp. MSJ-4]|uniref:SDR family oxidoreductase n=1 Tax=Clostridium simiarum TaxID=2841506 RepID=A0ABS6EYU6_9CLOT|nr:SDR family oxidoreductase [Clostridium simiarum]
MGKLTGKVAVITGASKGIGKSIAKKLALEGAAVVINYKNDDVSATEVVQEIKQTGGYAIKYKADISKYNEAKKLIEDTVNAFAKVDILINNAGISKIGLFTDMEEGDWDSLIDTNLKGIFNTCHNVANYMLNQKSGSIINISSIWGNVGASCEVIYSASKGGVNSFTKALAKELAPSHIRVNAISPGVIKTTMNSWLTEEEIISLKEEIPMGEFGEQEDVANLACFLCNDDSKYLTGQIITVDGGLI